MATIKERVLQTLGEDTTYLDDIPHINQLCDDAIWETASVLPARLLLTEVDAPVNPEATAGGTATGDVVSVDDSIVLQVYRVQKTAAAEVATSYTRRLCHQISKEESMKAMDMNSIHYATIESPVWWLENIAGTPYVKVFPDCNGTSDATLPFGEGATEIYKYERQDDFDITDDGFDNIPDAAEELIVQRIALRVLDHKIANASTQEEDQEMFGILGGARELLSKNLLELMTQIRDTWENKV